MSSNGTEDSRGWVKLHRRLMHHPMFPDDGWFKVLSFLTMSATHTPRPARFRGRIIKLQPGQTICGRHALAKACGVTPSKIVRLLKLLVVEGEITLEPSTTSTLVTLVHWRTDQENPGQRKNSANGCVAKPTEDPENESGQRPDNAFEGFGKKHPKIGQRKNSAKARHSRAAKASKKQIGQRADNGRTTAGHCTRREALENERKEGDVFSSRKKKATPCEETPLREDYDSVAFRSTFIAFFEKHRLVPNAAWNLRDEYQRTGWPADWRAELLASCDKQPEDDAEGNRHA